MEGEKGLSQVCDTSQTFARLVSEQDEAVERGQWPPGAPCTPWQQDSAVTQGLGGTAHCQLENFNTEVGCRSVG